MSAPVLPPPTQIGIGKEGSDRAVDLLVEICLVAPAEALLVEFVDGISGVGEFDEAKEPLEQASLDAYNAEAAIILLELLEKVKNENSEDNGL